MSSFALKIIALISMVIDHVGKVFCRSEWWMECVGRLAFPIFAYQAAVGYRRTRDVRKYVKRLAVFAVVSQAPYSLFMGMLGEDIMRMNVGFTLLFAVVMLITAEYMAQWKGKWWAIVPVVAVCVAAELLKADYGAYGVAMVGLFYCLGQMLEDKWVPRRQLAMQTAAIVAMYGAITIAKYLSWVVQYPEYGTMYGWEIIWTIMALVPILAHDGRRGRSGKWLFYIFYPAHLVVLYIIYMLI